MVPPSLLGATTAPPLPLGGSSVPWKSLNARICTCTGAVAIDASDGVDERAGTDGTAAGAGSGAHATASVVAWTPRASSARTDRPFTARDFTASRDSGRYLLSMSDLEARLVDLELRFMTIERYTQELSDVVAAQQRTIETLTRDTKRLAARLSDTGEAAPPDAPPPHY